MYNHVERRNINLYHKSPEHTMLKNSLEIKPDHPQDALSQKDIIMEK